MDELNDEILFLFEKLIEALTENNNDITMIRYVEEIKDDFEVGLVSSNSEEDDA